MKKSKKIKNYFTHYELAIGLSAVALIYGVIDPAEVAGFNAYIAEYRKMLAVEKLAVESI